MNRRLCIAFFFFIAPVPALAEVGDKLPSTTLLWCTALVLTVAAFVLTRLRPWCGLLVLPLWLLWAISGQMEIASPDVGPVIVRELGSSYIATSYLTWALGLLGPLMVVLLARRRLRR